MPIVTIQATVNQTPDPLLVTDLAVTTPTNTGHANSQAIDTGIPVAQTKSCRWSAFGAPTGPITSVRLKFDWQIPAGGGNTDISGGGTASASASFIVSLSTNGGASFPTNLLSRSFSITGNDDASLIEGPASVDFNVPLPVDVSQIQVRDRLSANAAQAGGGLASASVTANISNLRLEITTQELQPVFIS
jgi:hypothetical protein